MSTYKLLSKPGWGSVIAEAALAVGGLAYEIETVEMDGPREHLRSLNPLGQLPTLVLPDGRIMTESAAIVLHVADMNPAAGLAPSADDPSRPTFLRWLVFLVGSVYPTFTFGDDTTRWVSGKAAQDELMRKTIEYRCRLWSVIEEAAKGPWFLGQHFSAIDLYLAPMTRWRPRRDWFAANCPRLHAIALKADAHPGAAPVWKRNFG